ncbi:Protein of unknown function (DUF2935) [Desulfosporosinus orientis DSM 765]|uniref:DUF2935 domain-containing protein n=1 Tax=Desulfosporosinus orientis (strain ATCC 19365 / DSM 765 / NCIMB 8382 / VKM B-1628 / Singapore I) TaxID=768706 RepID=G7WH61_DESOD|nr:DUF2935 domain-containing protein [Desulfosporosinus orientis]AET69569.1 Protein of unknown function (DUF2935) [Desulfosporosinus orientis DSM 765]
MTVRSSKDALYEHRFWLQVLGDHARFIIKALVPSESEEVSRTYYLIQEFDRLLIYVRQDLSREELNSLHQPICQLVQQLKEFKFHLIQRHLEGQIGLNLQPTFVSHMVNELEEYQKILDFLTKWEAPPLFHPTHYHLLWLLDAAGHADAITTSLDSVEKPLRAKSQRFNIDFDYLYLNSHEMAGFTRALQYFPSLAGFNSKAATQILLFEDFLLELQEKLLSKTVLGNLYPLLLDHMLREECYYLIKLSSVSDVTCPTCDPGKPRIMEKI